MNSRVFLVGSGPGDPDLITRRGYRLVLDCDVLIHDSLVPLQLVQESRAPTKIHVGKTRDGHAMRQAEVCQLLIDHARAQPDRRIVRLKGGDPGLFGRGAEEAIACVRAGVVVEIVPGVTAASAASACAGIPLTHRDQSAGVVFVTGHLKSGHSRELPYRALVQTGLTLVFYMAISRLKQTIESLVAAGLDPKIEAAVVQEACMAGQRIVLAPLDRLAHACTEAGIRPPATMIIGNVVKYASQIGQQLPKKLAGQSIVVLRPSERRYIEFNRLQELGARVVDTPVVRIVPKLNSPEVVSMLDAIGADHVVVFASTKAARLFDDLWKRQSARPQPTFTGTRTSVMNELSALGLLRPEQDSRRTHDFSIRWAALRQPTISWLVGRRVDVTGRGLSVDRTVELYDLAEQPISKDIEAMLTQGRVDSVVFLSPTTVLPLAKQFSASDIPGARYAAISHRTAQLADEHGFHCDLVANGTLDDLIDKLASD